MVNDNVMLSIIIPVFNGEKFLQKTIDSALTNTTGLRIEIVVINDGSTDGTGSILSKYSDKVRILHQSNAGESLAVNKGIENCRGELALVLSADDPCPDKELFNIAIDMFKQNDNLQCIYPDWSIIDENGLNIQTIQVREFSLEEMIADFICIPGPGSIFKVKSAREIFGRRAKWKFVGDFEFWLRLAQVGGFARIKKPLAYWRAHEDSTSLKYRSKEMAEERIAVMREFFDLNVDFDYLRGKSLGNCYYSSARLCYFSKKIPAKKYLLYSIFFDPGSLKRRRKIELAFIIFNPFSRLLKRFFDVSRVK